MFTLKATVFILVVVYCRAAQVSYDKENVVTDFKPYNKTWEDFKQKFGRVFSSAEEEAYRYGVFVASLQTIESHNKEYLEKRQSFFMGIGPFTDKTDKELPVSKCQILEEEEAISDADWPGTRRKRQSGFCQLYPTSETSDLPDTWDWRDRDGVVSPVLDQGACGSCYAFGVTTSLESQVKLKFGKTVRLSQQQFVDCFKQNCVGVKSIESVFIYLNQSGGAWSASDYPYKSTSDKAVVNVCPDVKPKAVACVTGCYYGSNSEALLQATVAKDGPVWVVVAAGNWGHYSDGIIGSSTCGSMVADHCVSVVGYGTEGSQAYWIAKNSWGQQWGSLGGYVKIARNQNFACRIGTQFGVPIAGAGYQIAVSTLCLVATLILALII